MIRVQDHEVKYSDRNNSAGDCLILLKFRIEVDRGEAGLLHMFKVKGQSSRSQRNVRYQQEKRSKTATDRLSDFKLGIGDELKRIGTARRWAAASCNAFAITTFTSCSFTYDRTWRIDLMGVLCTTADNRELLKRKTRKRGNCECIAT